MSDTVQILVLSGLVNGLVTWGVINTKLAWLRADVDALRKWQQQVIAERTSEPAKTR
jgi:hypothetical protein